MGEETANLAGVPALQLRLVTKAAAVTTAADTTEAAKMMLAARVDLLLFVGGDGTARDVAQGVGEGLPALGIPAGVKMQSAVFAVSPLAAAESAAAFLRDRSRTVTKREVVDLAEETLQAGRISARLYGYLSVPAVRRWLQSRKVGSTASAGTVEDIARAIVAQMSPDVLYVLGPGTTVQSVATRLGIVKTLMGVDVVASGELVASDVTAVKLENLAKPNTVIFISPTGGQGFLFGRGNQQISAVVLERVGLKGVVVLCTPEKLAGFSGHPLLVDTGDPAVDAKLTGYVRVVTGYRESTFYRVEGMKE
jgi:predicted polyphosphate/ATP-dependent NAD kinase